MEKHVTNICVIACISSRLTQQIGQNEHLYATIKYELRRRQDEIQIVIYKIKVATRNAFVNLKLFEYH